MRTLQRRNSAGQTTIGAVLVIALVIVGSTAVVALGDRALDDTRENSGLARAEQSMTLFDSQAAQVALGDASNQRVNFGERGGSYTVEDDAGWIEIIQLDCENDNVNDDADDVVDTSNTDEDDAYIMERKALGAMVHRTGDTEIGYQGGGVWRRGPDGGVEMVSPPEFHYRGATLTLPIVLTRGDGAVTGRASGTVEEGIRAKPVFPSGETFPSRCGGGDFVNPVRKGEVIVRIESRYARGWGRYFDARTSGEISYADRDGDGVEEVTIRLVSLENPGSFGMPGEGGSVTVPGTSDHNVEEFSLTLRPEDHDSANFNNLQWSMYIEEGDQQFELYFTKSGGSGCPSTGITADVTVYYSEDGGDNYEMWHANDVFEAKCEDRDGDGNDDEIYFEMSFVDDDDNDGDVSDAEGTDPTLDYTKNGDNMLKFKANGNLRNPSETFDSHSADVSWEGSQYDSGDTETVDRVLNHYFGMFDDELDLTVKDKPGGGGSVEETGPDSSSGVLDVPGGGKYVTYLHVTRNEIEVRLD
ncbi:hypothetical protein ACFQE8_01255 [Salinirubellus sp. GCM10025818]|uniref:DUF7289 family protein n=1 Tax=Salinirubellus TaxID=2162630 RepID=UPI0030D4F1DE